MLATSVDRTRSILLLRLTGPVDRGILMKAQEMIARYRERHGVADVIFDCSGATGAIDSVFVVTRGREPGVMEGRRRCLVAGTDHLYGMARMYSAHKEAMGDVPPFVARTVQQAYELFGTTAEAFEDFET